MSSSRASGWRWVAAAAVMGFLVSGLTTSVLGLPRHAFVAAWSAAVAALWLAYSRAGHVHLRVQGARHLPAGLIVGAVIGALLVATVLRQPGAAAPEGLALGIDLIWLGAVYGSVDALILAVLPVVALYGVRAPETRVPGGRLRRAAAAVAGSALITAAYHLGFREFQGVQVALPVIGGVLTAAAYLLSGSAVAPIVAHVMMHVAAVLHGAATTVQLPPHY